MMSICSQSAPLSIVVEQAAPNAPKSADKIEGAMIALGDIVLLLGVAVALTGEVRYVIILERSNLGLLVGLMEGPESSLALNLGS